MANATTRDARAGWDIFYTSGGAVTMEDINSALASAGYNPIHQRTYTHYGNLQQAGYNRYLSINRFDIAQSNDPYEQVNSSSLYSFRDSTIGVTAVFAKSSRLLEATGQARAIGDVGATLQFPDRAISDGLRSMRPAVGDMISIRFLEAQTNIAARVMDRDLVSDTVSIEVEYTRLISIASIAPALARELDNVQRGFALVAVDDTQETLDVVGRRISSLFDLIEGARSLVNAAGSSQSDAVYAAPPVLERLSFASPVQAELQLAHEAYEVIRHLGIYGFLSAVMTAVLARKYWYEGSAKRAEAELNKEKLRKKQKAANADKAEAEVAVMQVPKVDNSKATLEERSSARDVQSTEKALTTAASSLETEGVTAIRQLMPNSTISDDEIRRHVHRHIVPVLSALAESGVIEISLPGDPAPNSQLDGLSRGD